MAKSVIGDISVEGLQKRYKALMEPPFVRSAYNYDRDAASDESGLLCLDPSMANQSAKDECDINKIIESFIRTGELPVYDFTNEVTDFTNVIGDYHTALNAIKSTDALFMQLPARVRAELGNDPANLISLLSDEKNYDRALELGLVNPRDSSSLSTGGKRVSNAQAQPPVGKDVTSATPPAKKASSLKNKLSALINDIPDSEEI